MRPLSDSPIRLGAGHCCLCATVCHHIGPVQLCEQHRQPAVARPLRTEEEVRADGLRTAGEEAGDGR